DIDARQTDAIFQQTHRIVAVDIGRDGDRTKRRDAFPLGDDALDAAYEKRALLLTGISRRNARERRDCFVDLIALTGDAWQLRRRNLDDVSWRVTGEELVVTIIDDAAVGGNRQN